MTKKELEKVISFLEEKYVLLIPLNELNGFTPRRYIAVSNSHGGYYVFDGFQRINGKAVADLSNLIEAIYLRKEGSRKREKDITREVRKINPALEFNPNRVFAIT